MKFSVLTTDQQTNARSGRFETDHGSFETPTFMPVGTLGSVKGIHQRELENDIRAQVLLGNTYHLFLRPGTTIIEAAGGLHQFMGWKRPILTDSGGYQVYSLGKIRKISEEGVQFQSHIDGASHMFTPQSVVDIQRSIGADIIMAFDECTPYPCSYEYAQNSMDLTHRWLDLCLERFHATTPLYGYDQTLFPIIQGSVYKDLRMQSTEYMAEKNTVGIAIGGLSVGEPVDQMYEMTGRVCEQLPADQARYLMGVGTPANILNGIELGIDMFDCVIPTRNARHGLMYTPEGIINIKNKKWKKDFTPVNDPPLSYLDHYYTKAYIRHLMHSNEILGAQIASIQNLVFYLWLMDEAKHKIKEATFKSWKASMEAKVSTRL